MKKKQSENYLEKIPCINSKIKWSQDSNSNITLEIENRGAANRFAQLVFKKPKISFIHLEEFGSFIWLQIDGQRDIFATAKVILQRLRLAVIFYSP